MSDLPLLELRGRNGAPITSGRDAELWLNGQRIGGVKDVVLHLGVDGLVEAEIKMFCRLGSAHPPTAFESAIAEVAERPE